MRHYTIHGVALTLCGANRVSNGSNAVKSLRGRRGQSYDTCGSHAVGNTEFAVKKHLHDAPFLSTRLSTSKVLHSLRCRVNACYEYRSAIFQRDMPHSCPMFCGQESSGTGLTRIKPFRATSTALVDRERKTHIMHTTHLWRLEILCKAPVRTTKCY